MQKIMFNDRFLLTQAVLDGRKTQTRRIVTPQPYYDEKIYAEQGYEYRGGRRTERLMDGISVEEARTELTTGCPFCHRSFVD